MKLKPYKKDNDFSYALGLFPTLELLEVRPDLARRVFLSSKIKPSTGLQKIRTLCQANNVPIEETEHSLIERIARSENCFAIGVFTKSMSQLQQGTPHVVLVKPDDMGNLGTIMRTCLGFDIADIAIIMPAADAFDPKTVRASMGALFKMRVEQFATFNDYQLAFANRPLYPFILHGQQRLHDVVFAHNASLVFGNEGAGLPPEFAGIGTTVTIEQSNNIDSLNLALAVGIALHHRYAATM